MKPISIDQLSDMWDKDAEIDSTEPGKEVIKIPILHSKYVKQHSAHTLASKQCAFEYAKLKKIKWEYFQGRLDDDELKKYGWEPFRFVLKSDIASYMEADEDLSKILAKKALHDQAAEFCSLVIKEINARTYQIRAYMDWEKFINGQG